MPKLHSRAIKCTLVLDPIEVQGLPDIGTPRVVLHIQLPDRTVTVDVASKSVRKALSLLAEHGTDAVAVLLQGKLTRGDVLAECGLVAQVKAPKPVAEVVAS